MTQKDFSPKKLFAETPCIRIRYPSLLGFGILLGGGGLATIYIAPPQGNPRPRGENPMTPGPVQGTYTFTLRSGEVVRTVGWSPEDVLWRTMYRFARRNVDSTRGSKILPQKGVPKS